MQKYFCTVKKVTDENYAGLKADQARILFIIANAGAEGATDADLLAVNENGEPVTGDEKGLKVKTALLRTGLIRAETVPGERKGSERLYQYTGVPIGEHLSKSLRRVGGAVSVVGTGTKTQFAEELRKQAEANGVEMDEKKSISTVNGVWLRLQDLGIVEAVKKSDVAKQEAASDVAPETETTADDEAAEE